jgi:hypothetical protein
MTDRQDWRSNVSANLIETGYNALAFNSTAARVSLTLSSGGYFSDYKQILKRENFKKTHRF